MVHSSAVTEMDADVATIAVSGLSFYYSSVAVVPVLAETTVDAITLAVDANLSTYTKRSAECTPFITCSISLHISIRIYFIFLISFISFTIFFLLFLLNAPIHNRYTYAKGRNILCL